MKHTDIFKSFLEDTVNLNSTRIADLERTTEAIKKAVSSSNWEPSISSWMPQGSWAHKTIIRPVDSGEFDADLLVFAHPVKGWTAKKYIDELYNSLKSNGTYADKISRSSHCVTITYASEQRVDVAPCIINRGGYQRLEVCNRDKDEFELTEPRKYTEWLIEKNGLTKNNSFRKVTRLVKYLRDIKGTFSCTSVLLTTILAYRVDPFDIFENDFPDTPTALKTIFQRLDDWAQSHPTKPSVHNPFLYSEDFAKSWNDTQYANFRNVISRYRAWIDEAYGEKDRNESISKWRRIFGDEFAKDIVVEIAKSASSLVSEELRNSSGGLVTFDGDLVAAITKFGPAALPPNFDALPHMQSPRWRKAQGPATPVEVRAELFRYERANSLGPIQSLQPVPPGFWIKFTAHTSFGLSFPPNDFRVEWRITNTGWQAYKAGSLRGGFDASDKSGARWEQLMFRGVHLAEAFVIRKRDDALIGKSKAFHVVIDA
jgi:hypothetical protein